MDDGTRDFGETAKSRMFWRGRLKTDPARRAHEWLGSDEGVEKWLSAPTL
jgi:hypothetical protein